MTEREKFYSAIDDIEKIAKNSGLDFYNTHFKLVPATKMYEFGAYGIPGRFSHWTFGKDYWQMKTMYDYGLSKIYELVINANPSLAYCMETNDLVENMAVAAHVLGHTDFFKNNVWFEHTDRHMPDTVSVHAERMREFTKEFGVDTVEEWQDHVLAIQMNFDSNPESFNRPTSQEYMLQSREEGKKRQNIRKSPSTPYDDIWDLAIQKREEKVEEVKVTLPYEEEADLLWLIAEFSPQNLTDWQKDILLMVRNEQQYFLPQMQTKLMNEGWAAFWHANIMRKMFDMGKLSEDDWWRFAKMHSGVITTRKNLLNPYFVGMKIYEDIDRKYKGILHPNGATEKNWLGEELNPKDTEGDPRYDIFKVREQYNDKWFMRDYLPDYLIEDLDLYIYEKKGDDWVITEKDPEKIRLSIAEDMTNFGRPVIYVPIDGADYNQKRELYLKHSQQGNKEIKADWAQKALQHVYTLWGRPVHLETVLDHKKTLFTFDGNSSSVRTL